MSDPFSRTYTKYLTEKGFSDPFLLPSSESMPTSFGSDTMDFCLYLYGVNPTFRHAARRVNSHFITDVEFEGKSGDEKEQQEHREWMRDGLRIFEHQNEQGDEFNTYGNGFSWIFFPFNRYLIDHRDSLREYALGIFPPGEVKYDASTMKYDVPDPTTFHLSANKRQRIKLSFRDRKVLDLNRVALRKLDPRHMNLQYSICSGACEYVWRFDPELLSDIKSGVLYQVNETPLPMLQAIKNDQDFKFGPDQIFHLKAPTISGISNGGWGLPEVLANYRSIHSLQVYRKIDEAIGLDYVLPFRVLTPNISPDKVGEGAAMTLMSQWRNQMTEMIRRRRADPFAIHALPLPVNMQQFGADSGKLVSPEMLKYQTDTMLDSMGIPAEYFHGSMQVQQIPTTLRIFENHYFYIYGGFNRMLQWASRRVQEWRNAEPMKVRQQRPNLADDIEKRSLYLQLVAGGEVPRRVGYAPIGISDPVEAAKQRAREDAEIAKVQENIKKEYDREAQLGSMTDQLAEAEAAGGAAAGAAPAGGVPTTPLDQNSKIETEAMNILAIPDQGTRNKAWAQLQASNYQLYVQVKQRVEEMRSQNASAGRAQSTQVAQQAMGVAPQ